MNTKTTRAIVFVIFIIAAVAVILFEKSKPQVVKANAGFKPLNVFGGQDDSLFLTDSDRELYKLEAGSKKAGKLNIKADEVCAEGSRILVLSDNSVSFVKASDTDLSVDEKDFCKFINECARISRIAAISGGWYSLCVLLENGDVYCDKNVFEPDGIYSEVLSANKVLCGIDVSDICVGRDHILALDRQGNVYEQSFEKSSDKQVHKIDIPQKVIKLRAGDGGSAALTEKGKLYVWGSTAASLIDSKEPYEKRTELHSLSEEYTVRDFDFYNSLVCFATDENKVYRFGSFGERNTKAIREIDTPEYVCKIESDSKIAVLPSYFAEVKANGSIILRSFD